MNDHDARAGITELLARYCIALDRDDIDAVAGLFTDDAEFAVFGRVYEGPDEVRRVLTGAPRGLHVGGLPVITFGHAGASVAQNLVYVDATTHAMRLVIYDDIVTETPAGWRFRRRKINFVGADGLVDHPPVIGPPVVGPPDA